MVVKTGIFPWLLENITNVVELALGGTCWDQVHGKKYLKYRV